MILLVHGWGYDATVWDGVCGELADLPVARVDLGFFGDSAGNTLPDNDEPLLGVGHSLGFLWLLRHAALRCRAVLSVNGFARFTEEAGYPGVSPAALALMRRRFARDPAAALSAFWRDCGAAPDLDMRKTDSAALLQGLDWLLDWDERAALAAMPAVHALASRDDAVVPPAMTEAAFSGRGIEWTEYSGHCLPLLNPRLVADKIRRTYRQLA